MKYIIEEKRWIRGEIGGLSFLLRNDDLKMCCLGFVCKQFDSDVIDDQIIDRFLLSEVVYDNSDVKIPEWLVKNNLDTNDCIALMNINDDQDMCDDLRKILIANIFAKHGDEVVFIPDQSPLEE